MSEEHSDTELLRRFRAGEPDVFAPIVERYQDQVYTLCLRILGDPSQAEATAHAVFMAAYQGLGQLMPSEEVRTWLLQVTVDLCIEATDEQREDVDFNDLTTRSRLIQEAVANIDLPFRAALVLCDILSLPHDLVAEVLGLPVGTTRCRVHHARMDLATSLAPHLDAL